MDFRKRIRDNPSFLATSEYFDYVLDNQKIDRLNLQTGPNCNRTCKHCYGGFGEHREGLPDAGRHGSAIEQAVDLGFRYCILTDGEPIREENRALLKKASEYSDRLPVSIHTNGFFASSEAEAVSWIGFLKDSGYDLRRPGNCIHISYGTTYQVPIEFSANMISALRQVYGHFNIGMHLVLRGITVGDRKEQKMTDFLASSLEQAFGKCSESIRKEHKTELSYTDAIVFPQGSFPVYVRWIPPKPWGSALSMPLVQDMYPKKEIRQEEIPFLPNVKGKPMFVDHKENVYWGSTKELVRKGRLAGNLRLESLGRIRDRVLSDPLYLAYQLGGNKFMHFLAEGLRPGYTVVGRTPGHASTQFFEDTCLVSDSRVKLDRDGLKKTYFEFAEKVLI